MKNLSKRVVFLILITQLLWFSGGDYSAASASETQNYFSSNLWTKEFGRDNWGIQNDYPRLLGDMNNDGYPDIVGFASNGVVIGLNQYGNGTDGFLSSLWAKDFGKDNWNTQNDYPRLLADMNKDGYPDLVGFSAEGVVVGLNQYGSGTQGFTPSLWTKDFGKEAGWSTLDDYPRLIADMNRDGYPDIVGFTSQGVIVGLNQFGSGKQGFELSLWTKDFGKEAGWSTQNDYPRLVGDVNNDGYPDIVGFSSEGVVVGLNQFGSGRQGFELSLWTKDFGKEEGWSTQNEYPRMLADMDKDGYPDIVGFSAEGVKVALNQFGSGRQWFYSNMWSKDYGKNYWSTQGEYPRMLADMDKDGYPDIVGFSSTGTMVAINKFLAPIQTPSQTPTTTPTPTSEPNRNQTPTTNPNTKVITIAMTNGTVREYTLTLDKLADLLQWYDDCSTGTGKAYYIIETIDANAKIRKEYLFFKNIFSFRIIE